MLPEREPNMHEMYMRTIATAWFKMNSTKGTHV